MVRPVLTLTKEPEFGYLPLAECALLGSTCSIAGTSGDMVAATAAATTIKLR